MVPSPPATASKIASSMLAPKAPVAYETTVNLTTYNYTQALQPSQPDDPIYPYPHLDFDRVGPASSQAYHAIVLENGYTSLTILPDLGGRILRWIDKATGKNLFYANPVIKPTQWGYRGWWLATGGMEWAFPVEEHGLNEWRSWNYHIERSGGTVTARVTDVDDRTGLTIEVAITLDTQHSYITIRPRIANSTTQPQRYQFWLNGMFSLGKNHVSGNTQFIVPAQRVTIHSTGDSSLPNAHQTSAWPMIGGRDMSWYKNWSAWLGFFESPSAQGGFMGAYNHDTDLGVVRVYPVGVAQGAKVFAGAGLDPGLWTDGNSSYFELWGGLLPTFWDYTNIAPSASVGWSEQWYAVSGIDGYDFANLNGAVRLSDAGGRITVALSTPYIAAGNVIVWHEEKPIANWPISIGPGQPFVRSIENPVGSGGAIGVQLIDSSGKVILQYGSVGK
jgi:hypothetical protein